jgi:hypothetical protein
MGLSSRNGHTDKGHTGKGHTGKGHAGKATGFGWRFPRGDNPAP